MPREESAITVPVTITTAPSASGPPRAHGSVNLAVKALDTGTALKTLRQAGSLKALFPRTRGPDLQAVLINTAGGVTGGDTFQTEVRAQTGTQLTITTQASERVYRAATGETAKISNHLTVGTGARLNWLPQETILFQGCAVHRSLRIEMADDASLLMVEPVVFGRKAMGEILTDATFTDRIKIYRNDQPAYIDALKWRGDIAAQLDRPHIAAGAGAMASLVFVAKDAGTSLTVLRDMIGETGGASLIDGDFLVLRLLAPDSYLLRKSLIPILNYLTNDTLPRCWMI